MEGVAVQRTRQELFVCYRQACEKTDFISGVLDRSGGVTWKPKIKLRD